MNPIDPKWRRWRPEPKKRKVWVIYGDGWLWDGLSPWVCSTQPDREVGITFRTQQSALAMVAQLKRKSSHTRRYTVRSA